jgi:hypothetical protein
MTAKQQKNADLLHQWQAKEKQELEEFKSHERLIEQDLSIQVSKSSRNESVLGNRSLQRPKSQALFRSSSR